MTILLLMGEPSLTVAPNGDGGAILTVLCKNHPTHGTRIAFDKATLVEFMNAFHSRLSHFGKSEILPGQAQMHLVREENRLRFVLTAWRDPKEHPDRPPPELVFGIEAAKKLYREIAKVSGVGLVVL